MAFPLNDDLIVVIKERKSKLLEPSRFLNKKWHRTGFPDSYSVLTPFAYAYLEELIRSTTSEYGIVALDEVGNIKKRRKVGVDLLNLAIKENKNNPELVSLLQKMKSYYIPSQLTDRGDNRHSVVHGYMHPRFWDKSSFEKLVHDIALISKHARF